MSERVAAVATPGPYPALTDEPEQLRFVRVDATHCPGEYEPEADEPLLAQKVYAELIEEAVEAEALGWDRLSSLSITSMPGRWRHHPNLMEALVLPIGMPFLGRA
jgi:hypothetical protein